MTGTEIALVINATGAFITSIFGVIVSLLNKVKIEQVHQTTNSKMDRLLSVTATAAYAEGVKEAKEKTTTI